MTYWHFDQIMRGRLQIRSIGLSQKHMLMKQTHIMCDKTPLILCTEITLLVSHLTVRFILKMKILVTRAHYKARNTKRQWIYRSGNNEDDY